MNKDVADAIKNLRNALRSIGVEGTPTIMLPNGTDVLRVAHKLDMGGDVVRGYWLFKYYGVKIFSVEGGSE